MNQHFEESARVGYRERDDDPIRKLTLAEQRPIATPFRFGISPARLIPWPELAYRADIKNRLRKGLEEAGREWGANPKEWMGSLESISLDDLTIEYMPNGGPETWVSYAEQVAAMKDAWERKLLTDRMDADGY